MFSSTVKDLRSSSTAFRALDGADSLLFAQGHVSAEALVDGPLRDQVRSAITNAAGSAHASNWLALVPPDGAAVERDKVTVSYAVIANSKAKGIEWLPFFSRLTLMQNVRDLNRLGFTKIALARVPVEDNAQ